MSGSNRVAPSLGRGAILARLMQDLSVAPGPSRPSPRTLGPRCPFGPGPRVSLGHEALFFGQDVTTKRSIRESRGKA